MTSITKSHPLVKILSGALYDLPSPSNFSSWWNFGSLLGLCLVLQVLTGLFLSMHFCSDASLAFKSVSHISRDVNYGWLLRMFHANGASFFFFCLFFHIGRGLYYGSYLFTHTWNMGTVILLCVMATAFLGYVLPWGQMSFWGATVITNLFSAIPYIGKDLVEWMWGGFAVDNSTLMRFFSLHFMLPFVIMGMSGVHLLFLHQTGSNNPLGMNSNYDKISFHPYYTYKDLYGFCILLMFLFYTVLYNPWTLGDPENFIPANPLVTPVHIQPEWYFLMAYAILRSIPNKLGGVIALAMSIVILMICPFMYKSKFRGFSFYPVSKLYFWAHVNVWGLLTWLGARPVEDPYIFIGQIFSLIYFIYYFMSFLLLMIWDKLLE